MSSAAPTAMNGPPARAAPANARTRSTRSTIAATLATVSQGSGRRSRHRRGEPRGMNIGLRTLLLLVAVVLFVIAAVSTSDWDKLVAWGLAATAAGLVVGDLGLGIPARRR